MTVINSELRKISKAFLSNKRVEADVNFESEGERACFKSRVPFRSSGITLGPVTCSKAGPCRSSNLSIRNDPKELVVPAGTTDQEISPEWEDVLTKDIYDCESM